MCVHTACARRYTLVGMYIYSAAHITVPMPRHKDLQRIRGEYASGFTMDSQKFATNMQIRGSSL